MAASLLVAAMVGAEPPPYTLSLDQSVHCPRDVNDGWYSQSTALAEPVHANASTALQAVINSIPSTLDDTLSMLHAPSAMFIAHHNGQTLFESYRGSSRLHSKTPVTADSGFLIASNSKVFTSVMLYMLRDEGKLPQGLDTTVAALMPNWIEPHQPLGAGGRASKRGLTLRALATHSSGLPREIPAGLLEHEQVILKNIGSARMLFPQYASTAYSNLGAALLGRTIEKATGGLSWEKWLETKIMRPLGMHSSGPCLRTAAEAATIVDGVDPSTGKLIDLEVFNATCPWGSPAGSVYSTPRDMARWASFLAGTLSAPDVLDPATVEEIRNTAMLQSDGISAVSGATFESAYSHHRWTFNKLGCLDGYRSVIVVVPSLGLSVFAAAASTCDIYGDGDAVGFPIVAKLIAPLEDILSARFAAVKRHLPPSAAADLPGGYDCGDTAQHNVSMASDGTLHLDRLGLYPWTLLPLDGQPDSYRLLMGELPQSTVGCSSAAWPGANLCHRSCFREMTRGDAELLLVRRDTHGRVVALDVPGEQIKCVRTTVGENKDVHRLGVRNG